MRVSLALLRSSTLLDGGLGHFVFLCNYIRTRLLHTGDRVSDGPFCILQDDSVAVWVLERHTLPIPVRVVGRDRLVPVRSHPCDCRFPHRPVREVEHHQIVLRRRAANRVASLSRELEVDLLARPSEHHAVEALVVLETAKDVKSQTVAVERHDLLEAVSRPRYTDPNTVAHRVFSFFT